MGRFLAMGLVKLSHNHKHVLCLDFQQIGFEGSMRWEESLPKQMGSLICYVEQTGRVLLANLRPFTGEACPRVECVSDSRAVLGGGGGQSLVFPTDQPQDLIAGMRAPPKPGLPSGFTFLETLEAFGCHPMGRGRGGICP